MSSFNRDKGQQSENSMSSKAKRVYKHPAGHESKASANSKALDCFKQFSRVPVVIKLSPEDSKAFVEVMGNSVDIDKVFAKAIKLHDRRVISE